jgi:DNA-binding transcriptional LysR family regulator
MSSGPGTPTLDQLRVFLTVVEVGSFAGAARKLGRATSVISYSIANLETQLGVSLFDRKSTRKRIKSFCIA